MVCQRCVMVVTRIAEDLSLPYEHIGMGHISFHQNLSDAQKAQLKNELQKVGFDIVSDRTEQIIEQIKSLIQKYLDDIQINRDMNLSTYITQHIFHDYSYLSDLFSKTVGHTIEQHFILQRLDKVKELIVYSDHSITDIAYTLGFSTSQHLSHQFKKIMGMSPSEFRTIHQVKKG